MSIFGSIMNKIFHHGQAAPAPAPAPVAQAPAAPSATPASPAPVTAAPAPTVQATPTTPVAPVDVNAVLTQIAASKGGASHWQTSIVDLLRLLDLDSSLSARKELADELNIHVGGDGTAEENIALHKAVMQKLAENGGKVPDSLKG
jgi:3-oxoacyl-ACP reductase-like protein